jgi:dihydroflavonol-4-reductase
MPTTVLLTGISGYVGLHCAKQLLDAGYIVRGTVRSKRKEDEARDTLQSASADTSRLSFVHLDLTSDEGWDDAIEGCGYLMHVASPFVVANPKNEQELIVPAVEGTRRALRAAHNAGVKRVVLTSSIVAMMGVKKTGTYGSEDWSDANAPDLNTYAKSKTLAEKAAWDFIAELPSDKPMGLVVINPATVFGP